MRQLAQNTLIVLGFAGPIGAGKTTAASYLSSKNGFQYARYSQVLSDCLAGGRQSREDLQAAGWEMMSSTRLQGELNRRLLERIKPDSSYVVDGLRHKIDEASLRTRFGSAFYLLYIDAPQALRWQRVRNRERFRNFPSFLKVDRHPVELSHRDLKKMAFEVIKNTGTLADFWRELDQVVARIESEGR